MNPKTNYFFCFDSSFFKKKSFIAASSYISCNGYNCLLFSIAIKITTVQNQKYMFALKTSSLYLKPLELEDKLMQLPNYKSSLTGYS